MNEHAPGWYDHEGERRYWDGQQWTHSTSAPQTPTPYSAPDAPPVPGGQVAPYGPQGAAGGPVSPFAPGTLPAARKEPALMLLASFFVPGLGSMLNGAVGAGVAFLSAYVGGWTLVVCLGWLLIGFIGVPIALIAWVWSMVHAYQGAVTFNQSVGYPG